MRHHPLLHCSASSQQAEAEVRLLGIGSIIAATGRSAEASLCNNLLGGFNQIRITSTHPTVGVTLLYLPLYNTYGDD